MKADKTFSGVTPDHGTILRVNTRKTSDSTAAMEEELSIYDSYSLGGHLRPVRRAVLMDRPLLGLSMLANDEPLVNVSWHQAIQSFKPREGLLALDEVISRIDSGVMRCPSVVVQVANTVIANSYKFAQSLVQAQAAWFDDRANWVAHYNDRDPNCLRAIHFNQSGRTVGELSPIDMYRRLGAGHTEGPPTRATANPYAQGLRTPRNHAASTSQMILLPACGQGPAPMLAINYREEGENGYWDDLIPLKWGIFYQEQDTEVASPMKKLIMIAYLNRLLDYFDGSRPELGQYRWPRPDGSISKAYTPRNNRLNEYTGHDITNRLLMEVARSAALRLNYKNAEELPGCEELNVIRAIANLLFLLDNKPLIISALLNTPDMKQFLALVLESYFAQQGVRTVVYQRTAEEVDIPVEIDNPNFDWDEASPIDVTAGFVPPEANHFLWNEIMGSIPADDFCSLVMRSLFGQNQAMDIDPASQGRIYGQLLAHSIIAQGVESPDYLLNEIRLLTNRNIISIKQMAADTRADYLAASLLARLRESVPVISRLLKGEIPGFEHLHTGQVPLISYEVAADIIDTFSTMLERDLISTQDILQWEEPFSGARYSTQWSTFSMRFPIYPVPYVIHDVSQDICAEVNYLKGRYGGGSEIATMVENAFATVGTTILQCEPAMTFVPLRSPNEQEAREGVLPKYQHFYLAGEREIAGWDVDHNAHELYGNISVAHAALRVTSTYFVRSNTVWNQIMEMPHTVTPRTYLPQPVPATWHSVAVMRVPVALVRNLLHRMQERSDCNAAAKVIVSILDSTPNSNNLTTGHFIHTIDLNPAFRDVGVCVPYVQMLVQTPPEAAYFRMLSRVNFEPSQRICTMNGEVLVLDHFVPNVANVAPSTSWQLPNLENELMYSPAPVTHMLLPLAWDAVR